MNAKDAVTSNFWKQRISMLLLGGAIVGGVFAIRGMLGPDNSSAQTTGNRTSPLRTARQAAATTRAPQTQAPSQVVRTAANAPVATLQTIQTMAMVNGQAITRDYLSQACLVRFGEQVLESLVNKHLIWQECQKKGIQITQQDVENEIQLEAKKFGIPVDQWLELLREKRGITKIKYQREITWPKLALRRLAAAQIQVTPDELEKAIETEYGARVSCRMIMIKDAQKAQAIRAQAAQAPAKFGQLAKDHSDDVNTASARGLIQPIRRHVGDPAIEKAAFALKEGEVSQVIPVAGQHVILKCEKIFPKSFIPAQNVEAAKRRLTDVIRDQKLRGAAAGLFERLEKEAKVVNVLNNPQLKAQHPGVAALINNQPITMAQLSMECIERHGLEVLEGEINRAVLSQELARRRITVTQQHVDTEVARAADAFGYLRDGKPDVAGWLAKVTKSENVTERVYIADAVWPSAALKQLVQTKIQVTQEDLKKGFEANYGPRVEVQAIVFNNARRAQQVWGQAKAIKTEAGFAKLAQQYSIEPVSRANDGRVPPIRKHSSHEKLEEEAFRLKPGELSSIVATGDKYIILRCIGRTTPVEVTFDEVKAELTRDISERKTRLEMAKEFDRLHDAARIDNHLATLVTGPKSPSRAAAATAPGVAPIRQARPTAGPRLPR